MKGGLLLDVVVSESAAILELLAGEDETLLVRGNALLVLDLALDHIDGIGALDLEGDGLACGQGKQGSALIATSQDICLVKLAKR